MTIKKMSAKDYPLGEKHQDMIKSKNGISLDELTLENIQKGALKIDDLQISSETLRYQGQISSDAGRHPLGKNLERAAEMVNIPNDLIMEIYEKLRPGRSESKNELLEYANLLKSKFKAKLLADFVTEAAHVYEKRGLYKTRY